MPGEIGESVHIEIPVLHDSAVLNDVPIPVGRSEAIDETGINRDFLIQRILL